MSAFLASAAISAELFFLMNPEPVRFIEPPLFSMSNVNDVESLSLLEPFIPVSGRDFWEPLLFMMVLLLKLPPLGCTYL